MVRNKTAAYAYVSTMKRKDFYTYVHKPDALKYIYKQNIPIIPRTVISTAQAIIQTYYWFIAIQLLGNQLTICYLQQCFWEA